MEIKEGQIYVIDFHSCKRLVKIYSIDNMLDRHKSVKWIYMDQPKRLSNGVEGFACGLHDGMSYNSFCALAKSYRLK